MPEDQESEQIAMMQRLVEMSAQRSYLNAERTLSVWTRTALALMVFGIAVDRFGLLLRHDTTAGHPLQDPLSTLGGVILVALGVLMALATGIRFLMYARAYRCEFQVPLRHGPSLAFAFAMGVAIIGAALLIALFLVTG
ncbi:MAG: DUF202 domain-containing protein [Rhodanobacteraceae bacterium]